MKILKNNLWNLAYTLPVLLLAAGCEKGLDDTKSNEPVELQINPIVALTRAVVAGGEQKGGTGAITEISVYATGAADYTDGNNYAKYTYSSGWANSDPDNKIYLTNVQATLYAYHPATDKVSSGTIPVTVKATGTIATVDNSADNATIAAATDEIDYLYATPATADNTAAKRSVELKMKHALSMVSFRVYKENYTGAGSLTQIILKNDDGKTALTTGNPNALNITTGVVTQTSPIAATYTRTISGYTLGTVPAANKLSLLVLPTTTAIPANEIKATFTIDGAPYTVALTAPTASDTDGKWMAGNNNVYTVKLSGTELSISKVEVTAWTDKNVNGDLTIN